MKRPAYRAAVADAINAARPPRPDALIMLALTPRQAQAVLAAINGPSVECPLLAGIYESLRARIEPAN